MSARLRPNRWCTGAAFVAVVALVPIARADTPDAGEAELQKGIQLRRESRDAEALEAFRRAYALHPTTRTRAQIALALQALGQWVPAEAELVAALADRDDPWVSNHREALEASRQIIAEHLATFEARSDTPSADILVNGSVVPPGKPVRVVAGSVVVEARAPGYVSVRRVVDVAAMTVARESFTMAKLDAPTLDEALRAPSVTRSAAPVASQMAPIAGTDPGVSPQRTWGWVALAAGGAVTGVAVAATVARETNASIYNDDVRCPPAERSRVCAAQRDNVNVATGVAIAGYIGGAALIATGALLLLNAPKAPAAAVQVGGWLTGVSAGITLGRAF